MYVVFVVYVVYVVCVVYVVYVVYVEHFFCSYKEKPLRLKNSPTGSQDPDTFKEDLCRVGQAAGRRPHFI